MVNPPRNPGELGTMGGRNRGQEAPREPRRTKRTTSEGEMRGAGREGSARARGVGGASLKDGPLTRRLGRRPILCRPRGPHRAAPYENRLRLANRSAPGYDALGGDMGGYHMSAVAARIPGLGAAPAWEGRRLACFLPQDQRHYLYDGLGSTRRLLDASGAGVGPRISR